MKRLLSFSLLALMLAFSACQEESSLLGPQNEDSSIANVSEPNWIGLPKALDTRLQKTFYASEFITTDNGGEIVINDTYGSANGQVTVSSSLYFPAGCVTEDHEIFMELDDVTGVSTFLPHQYFYTPAIINQRFEGVDLSFIDETQPVKYYYLTADGNYEEMECDNIIVDKTNGVLELVNGKIPHFSRYGFAN